MLVFKKSTRSDKKYMVTYNNKIIHFGNPYYEHYRDSTGVGAYSHMDHMDERRKKSYLKRAKGITDNDGNLTYNDKSSANYYAINYLWK